ncbi:MAG: selenide, water dikinase SelD [Planctomycetota bacterium]|jgi:selenide,water dikinase
MDERLPSRDIVLVGAGHTNMHIVRMWRMNPLPDTRLTLISPFSRATYSGMLPGTLAGLYSPREMEIDLWRFVAPSGVRLIIDEAIDVDGEQRRVHFSDRASIRFDVASIGVGSMPAGGDRWAEVASCLPVKPMATFRERLTARIELLRSRGHGDSDGSPIHAAVVGGGAAGVEVCFCLEALLRRDGVVANVTLVDSGESILDGYLPGTIRRVTAELNRRGVTQQLSSRVKHVDEQLLHLDDGRLIPVDLVIWVTGASPPPLIQKTNLPKGDDGFLAVDMTLQSTSGCPVFAVGDSASLVESPVAKSGVYAVREGPILWDNLRRTVENQSLRRYAPQAGFLSLLADGDGGAFLNYKRIAAAGRWCWQYKDHIDRKFMRMFHDYRPMAPSRQAGGSTASTPEQMRCRGCGGKAGASVLHAAFERLKESRPADNSPRHSAFESPEDAAWLDPQWGTPELISVDFFQPFLDDPWLVGRIAALNSLSDIWATGGQSFAALATVQLPEGSPCQQSEMLYQLLAGSLVEFEAAGVQLLGGHTTEGTELSIGFTVLGSLHGKSAMNKSGLQPGDVLVITKPLGTGTLLAGIPQAKTKAEWVDSMLSSMRQSNQHAAEVARVHNVRAMTDITGFGLAGHLFEMLDASGMSAELSLATVPLLDGFAELSASGIESTLAPSNREVADRITVASEPLKKMPQWHALFDPQTSGGLLIAVSEKQLPDLLQSMNDDLDFFTIGSVTGNSPVQAELTVVR